MKKYCTVFLLLLVTEVAIAVFHFHRLVRGFLGDVLVIPLVYAFIRALLRVSKIRAVLITAFIAIIVELLQACAVLEVMGIESKLLQLVLGSTFDPLDLLAYLMGVFVILIAEKLSEK